MISSTSITSTMGVTLMLELTLAPSFLTAIPIIASPALESILTNLVEAGPAAVRRT